MQAHRDEIVADADELLGSGVRSEHAECAAKWHVTMKRQARKALGDDAEGQALERCEQIKAKLRSQVENPFHVIKDLFGHRKTRYRGIAKIEGGGALPALSWIE